MELSICQRCGGVFRLECCLQCGWAGEPVTDRDRLVAHHRDDILDLHRLDAFRKRLVLEAARMGLAAYATQWREGEWHQTNLWTERDIIDEAIAYAFEEVESGRVVPQHFRGYFLSKARKRFRELVPEALNEQEKERRDFEAGKSGSG